LINYNTDSNLGKLVKEFKVRTPWWSG